MDAIGGYFGLELGRNDSNFWFSHLPALNSSRHALEYIIRQLSKKPDMIYVPYYTCEVVLEPIRRLNIPYQFYHIDDNLEIAELPKLGSDDYIIVNNYFGIKDSYIDSLLLHYKSQMLVDDAQAFYHPNHIGMRAIYSPRKFFGVPDGGFAWTPGTKEIELTQDFSTDRSAHLLRRIDAGAEAGYDEFQRDDASLSSEPMKAMSVLTRRILESIDYDDVKLRRRSNFEMLHEALGAVNKFDIPDMKSFACPMVYPFLTGDVSLRNKLIKNKIFVAKYWPNVLRWCDENMLEHELTEKLIPLPIDQRYEGKDMNRIIEIVNE